MRPILTLALAAALVAQDKPDFSGTWRLNLAESYYPNPSSVPSKLLKIVELKGNSLHYIIESTLNGKSGRTEIHLSIGEHDPTSNVIAHWEGRTWWSP